MNTPTNVHRQHLFPRASFSGGVLLLTTGSVLCHVIARHPESGGRAMHTPPLAVAIAFIVAGAIMVLASVIIVCR